MLSLLLLFLLSLFLFLFLSPSLLSLKQNRQQQQQQKKKGWELTIERRRKKRRKEKEREKEGAQSEKSRVAVRLLMKKRYCLPSLAAFLLAGTQVCYLAAAAAVMLPLLLPPAFPSPLLPLPLLHQLTVPVFSSFALLMACWSAQKGRERERAL